MAQASKVIAVDVFKDKDQDIYVVGFDGSGLRVGNWKVRVFEEQCCKSATVY